MHLRIIGGETLPERPRVVPLRNSASAILHSKSASGRANHSFGFIGNTLVTSRMTLKCYEPGDSIAGFIGG